MSDVIQAFLIVEVVRVICVLAGCLLAYLGYRLFRLGVYEKQGELKASYGKVTLALAQVGPGVFFALFGIAMASVGFIRKFEADAKMPGSLIPETPIAMRLEEAPTHVENSEELVNAQEGTNISKVVRSNHRSRRHVARTTEPTVMHDSVTRPASSHETTAPAQLGVMNDDGK